MHRPDRTISLTAWMVVGLGFLALALSFSARAVMSIAMPVWQSELGWSRSFVSSAAACSMIVMAVIAPFAGGLVDRYGPRSIMSCGLAFLAAGMFLVASISVESQEWKLLVGFSLLGGIGFGVLAQHVVATAIATRFTTRRGLATGLGVSGSSGGQLVLLPIFAMLFSAGAWQNSFWLLGASAIILIPVVWFSLKPSRGHAGKSSPEAGSAGKIKVSSMLKDKGFQVLFWSYLICGFTTSGVIETHLLPYAAMCGFAPVPSATAYGVLSAVNLGGMILAGWLTDRVNRPLLLFTIYVARALCFGLLLVVGDSYELLLAFAVLFGIFDYSTVPVTASLLGSRLGLRNLGLSLGLLSAGHAVGGASGAFFGGWVFDHTGEYVTLWYVSIMLAGLAAALIILLKQEKEPAGTAQVQNA